MAKSPRKTGKAPPVDQIEKALGRFASPVGSVGSSGPDEPVRLREDVTGARFLNYATAGGVRHELRFAGDQPWLTQRQLADMFGIDVRTANHHVQEFVAAGELDEGTIRKYRIVREEGGRKGERDIQHYALDVAFYVGDRANSTAGVLFRRRTPTRWSNSRSVERG